MTSLDRSGSPGPGEVEAAFGRHIERDAVDIVQDDESGDIEIHADDWTLALQGVPPSVAFFAVDDEPTEERELPGAVDAALDGDDLGGALQTALRASGDLLSVTLADRIAG